MMRTFAAFLALAILVAAVLPVSAGKPDVGMLYYNGTVVRTLILPASTPKEGRDNIYPIQGGVPGQLAVAAVAPGDKGYHGGHWAVHVVTWNVAPYLLTSAAEVLAAASGGDVTITRMRDADFKCPIQP